MRGRKLNAAEIDRLTHVARALKRAVNPDERTRCEANLVLVVNQLEGDDVRQARMLPHLGMSYKRLARAKSGQTRSSMARLTGRGADPDQPRTDIHRGLGRPIDHRVDDLSRPA